MKNILRRLLTKNMEKFINQLQREKATCIFVSPHLDDAVFSGGGLLTALQKKNIKTMVVTVFTKAGNKNTQSAKAFLRQCNYKYGVSLYKERVKEDKAALTGLSEVIHLDLVEALWRQKKKSLLKSIGNFIPESTTLYPTYRWHITKGIVASNDPLTEILKGKLDRLTSGKKNVLIFAPIGIGNHVDHVVVRKVCEALAVPVVYWADYPYSKTQKADSTFIKTNHLKKVEFSNFLKEKEDRMNIYKTQLHVFQPIKDRKELTETYYISI